MPRATTTDRSCARYSGPRVQRIVELPAGVHLCPCIHLVHRDPELYPEPERFRPERFLERKFGPHEWLPFGGALTRRVRSGVLIAPSDGVVVVAR